MELCIDGRCEQATVHASDSRDRSSDATFATIASTSPGTGNFDITTFTPKSDNDVILRIVALDSGTTIETYAGIVIFQVLQSNGPDRHDPPCWNAIIRL